MRRGRIVAWLYFGVWAAWFIGFAAFAILGMLEK